MARLVLGRVAGSKEEEEQEGTIRSLSGTFVGQRRSTGMFGAIAQESQRTNRRIGDTPKESDDRE
jgi:hypothetical protein